MDKLSKLRLTLHRQGYRPVPVSAHDLAGVEDAGKRPLLTGWKQICAEADEDVIISWEVSERRSPSTGLLCGLPGGIVAVDIDVLDEAAAHETQDWCRELLGETPLWRIGRAPKIAGVYRVTIDFRKLQTPAYKLPDGTTARVEVLSTGQQLMAFGVHPGTCCSYDWGNVSPVDVPQRDLPEVDEDNIRVLLTMAETVLRDRGGEIIGHQRPRKSEKDSNRSFKSDSDIKHLDRYTESALAGAVARIKTAGAGTRYDTLRDEAYSIGLRIVAKGGCSKIDAISRLVNAVPHTEWKLKPERVRTMVEDSVQAGARDGGRRHAA
jgi:putative DNA primase/helicase